MSEKKDLEDAELAADVNAVVAAMLCSFSIKVEVGAAVNTAEVEEREKGVSV
jgi:hypothetical protein